MKYNFPCLTIIAFGFILSPLKARFVLFKLKVSGLDVVQSLPGEWKEMKTEEGKSFYVDLANMKVQWERPRHGTQNRNPTSVQARGNFEPGCCPCPELPRPMKCYVSCCTKTIPRPGHVASDGTFVPLPVVLLGCWRDASPTANSPALQNVENILKQMYPEDATIEFREKAVVKCFLTAKYMGRKIFAVQNGGKCFVEGPAVPGKWKGDYKAYGPSDQCKVDGKGGVLANYVYGWMKQSDEGWEEYCPDECKTCDPGDSSDGGVPVNFNGFCQHFCRFDDILVRGYCGKGAKYESGADCTQCKPQTLYDCKDGQGEYGKELPNYHNICDMKECEKECTKNFKCKGFDFTPKECIFNSCRLYPRNNPRTDVGFHRRKYCERKEECTSKDDCKEKFGDEKPKCNDGVCHDPTKAPIPTPDTKPKIKSFGSFKWIVLEQSTVIELQQKTTNGLFRTRHDCQRLKDTNARSVLLCRPTLEKMLNHLPGTTRSTFGAYVIDKTTEKYLSLIPQWRDALKVCLPDALEFCNFFEILCEYNWNQAIDFAREIFRGKTQLDAIDPNDPQKCPAEWKDN